MYYYSYRGVSCNRDTAVYSCKQMLVCVSFGCNSFEPKKIKLSSLFPFYNMLYVIYTGEWDLMTVSVSIFEMFCIDLSCFGQYYKLS